MDSYIVRIDVEKVKANLRLAGEPTTDEHVENFLKEIGFIPQGNYWLCEEISLRGLDKSEYTIIRQDS